MTPEPQSPPQPEPKPTRGARLAELREWLISGHSPAEALRRGLQTWKLRPKRLRTAIARILERWAKEDAEEDPRYALALAKRQRDRLIAIASRQLDAALDRPADALLLMKLLDSMMRQRERLVRQIIAAGRPRPLRPDEPDLNGPRLDGPPPKLSEKEAAETRAWLKGMTPAEREELFERHRLPADIRQALRDALRDDLNAAPEGPAKAAGGTSYGPGRGPLGPGMAGQGQRKHTASAPPQSPWPPQADGWQEDAAKEGAAKGTFHVPLSIVGEKR